MKILFVHPSLQTFVAKDLEILRSQHEVRELHFKGLKSLRDLIQGVQWCELTFSWFGKLHAFFAVLFSKIFGKKSVVVSGGDDVACDLQIKYGMFAFWWKRWCPLFVFKNANLILCVSETNKQETIENAKADSQKIKLIYHGFASPPKSNERKSNEVVTIGHITSERIKVKGLDLFIKSAAFLPDVNFILVGRGEDKLVKELKAVATENVIFIGEIYSEQLKEVLSKAKVYVQVSARESFGCALAEAMLCECVPVVSRRAAIPEVVGDCGIYADELEPEKIAEKIREALSSDLGQKARNRIEKNFPLKKRKEELLEAINGSF